MKKKLMYSVCALAFSIFVSIPASASVGIDTNLLPKSHSGDFSISVAKDSDEYRNYILSQVQKYLRIDAGNNGYFDVEAAKLNHENEDVIYVGKQVNAFSQQHTQIQFRSSEWGIVKAGSGIFSGYRYCGYGNLGGKPTNTLDEGCKQHDECYEQRGWGKCSCDTEFISYIDKNSSKMGWVEWAQAQGAKIYFSLPGCKK